MPDPDDDMPSFGGMFPAGLPPEFVAMAQKMQNFMTSQSKAVMMSSALELLEIEIRAAMAEAEGEVATAEVALTEALLLDPELTDQRRKLLELQLAAQQRRETAIGSFAEQIRALYAVKQEMAGKDMALDPSELFGLFGAGGQHQPPEGLASGKPDDPRFDVPPPDGERD